MSQQLLLTAAAAAAADKFAGNVRTNPIEELGWALLGVVMTLLLVRAAARFRRQLPGADPFNASTASTVDQKAVLKLKMVQLLSSTIILTITHALLALSDWLKLLYSAEFVDREAHLSASLADILLFFQLTVGPVLVWHLADLIERPRTKSRLLAALTSHALLTGLLLAFSIAWLLWATGWFTDTRPCGGTFLLLMESCWYTNPAVSVPTVLLFIAPWPITLAKLAVAVWSRLGPR